MSNSKELKPKQPPPIPSGDLPVDKPADNGDFKIDEEFLSTTQVVDLYSKLKDVTENSTDISPHADLAL